MEGPRVCTATADAPLHTFRRHRLIPFNRLFAVVYTCALFYLFCYHIQKLRHSNNFASFCISISMLIADIFLAFMWCANQAHRMCPISRKQFPENLEKRVKTSDFPGLDVFICTADPYKEPPMSVVNTALSVMAYDYPTEKISVYVSDDGGSELTLFALMEAAKFASHWLPFCRKNKLVERSPEAFFGSNHHPYNLFPETEKIKSMYESMKVRVENVVERGKVGDEFISQEFERQAFTKWTSEFTRQDHPTVIQVLLDNSIDKDIAGHILPNLIYVSREKSRTSPHNFKGGALNVLIRVSATMTNAPLILILDCDMYSNDPQTARRVLCYIYDPEIKPKLGWVQFPQRFHNLTKNDIYAFEYRRIALINPKGLDGARGAIFQGTGGFFRRRAFFGGPSSFVSPEIPELDPDHVVDQPIQSQSTLRLAHHVARCNYENHTMWGYKMGFKHGTIVEDSYTSYMLHCEGWRSIYCSPDRAAFLGDMPITLIDGLNQNKRWTIGLLEVGLSKFPLTFGIRAIGPLMALGYSHFLLWAFWSIPLTIYAFLPQLALLHRVSIFPEVSEPWFFLYMFLVVGAYGQDFLDFVLAGGTVQRWWNHQRIWMIRGVSSYLFGFLEFSLKFLGISTPNFTLTSKVVDDDQSKRYEQGIFEFGVPSPMFVPIVMAAVINLLAFARGLVQVFKGKNGAERLCMLQMVIAGFVMVNSWPVYEGMVLRKDKGRMPTKTSAIGIVLSLALYAAASLVFKN